MSPIDLFWAADWNGLYFFLAKGNPPLIVQLLAINTIFFILYVVRRMSSKHKMRKSNQEVFQGVLIVVNFALVFQEYAWSWLNSSLVQKII